MHRFHLPSDDDGAPIEVEEAQSRVIRHARVLGTEAIPLGEGAGRVLAEDVVADRDVPSYRSSAMDGYAVRAADVAHASRESPAQLTLIGDAIAGHAHPVAVDRGTAVRIMTGGLVPEGADTIIPVEAASESGGRVTFVAPPALGQHVRRPGEDIERGTRALEAGLPLDAASHGVLASLGVLSVPVFRRPLLAILSTGDELVEADREPLAGQVVNSNVWTLESLAHDTGARINARSPIVRDDGGSGLDILRAQLETSDVVITTGGVSVGTHDWIRAALERLGADRLFWRVAMKPGKPIVAATIGEKLFFGLPGNPVSCAVGFHLFVAPALRTMMGMRHVLPPVVRCVAGAAMRASGRRSYLRVRITAENGTLIARPAVAQGSAVLSSLVQANGLAIVSPRSTETPVGSIIDVVIIGPLV